MDKARWTDEKVALLARKEAELCTRVPPSRFMNQELEKLFPSRTLEAIKSRRKRQDYRAMVEAIMNERGPETEANEFADSGDEVNADKELLGYLESLPKARLSG